MGFVVWWDLDDVSEIWSKRKVEKLNKGIQKDPETVNCGIVISQQWFAVKKPFEYMWKQNSICKFAS